MTDLVAGGKRINVADHLIVLAHIVAHDLDEAHIDIAAFGEFHNRNAKPFFVDRIGVGPETAPANIDDMRRAGEKADQSALVERRRHDRNVVQMAGAFPGIVGDVDVALVHEVVADLANEMADGFRHCVDMARRPGNRLRQHPALDVIDTGGQISRLAHRR